MTRPIWTPERRLLRDLADVFMGFPPRKTRKTAPRDVSRPEPAPLEDHDARKLETTGLTLKLEPIGIEVVVPKIEPAVTNTVEDVVGTCVESVPKVDRSDVRPRHHVDVTNAARQSRWRSKQDVDALRLQASARMKLLRARRRAAGA